MKTNFLPAVKMSVEYDEQRDITIYKMLDEHFNLVKVRFHFGEEICLDMISDDESEIEMRCDRILYNARAINEYKDYTNDQLTKLVINTALLTMSFD